MNYWNQFAEMLGLELGQQFELTDDAGNRKDKYTYKITEDGLLYKSPTLNWSISSLGTIGKILDGDVKAVHKPWKPTKREKYWYYSDTCKLAICVYWEDTARDLSFWKLGNCFRTEEEATTKGKEIMEQIQKEYEEN